MRATHSVHFDLGARIDLEADFARRATGLVRIGVWRTHPDGDPESSGANGDLGAWGAAYELQEKRADFPGAYLGVILTGGRRTRLGDSEPHGYVVRRDALTHRLWYQTARLQED